MADALDNTDPTLIIIHEFDRDKPAGAATSPSVIASVQGKEGV